MTGEKKNNVIKIIVVVIVITMFLVSGLSMFPNENIEEEEVTYEYVKPDQVELWLELLDESLTMDEESVIGHLVMKNVDNVTVYVDQDFIDGNTIRFYLTLNDIEYFNYLTPGIVPETPNPRILKPNQTLTYEFDIFKIEFRPPKESGISPNPDPIVWPVQGAHTIYAKYNDFITEPIEIIIL